VELSAKFIAKYMRMARQVGEDNNPCHSRKIGVVLVRLYDEGGGRPASKVVGTGYNGPPRGTPHCDDRGYLHDIVWPQLTPQERKTAAENAVEQRCETVPCDLYDGLSEWAREQLFLHHAAGCGVCPRKLAGAKSGERLELCSCEHAEKNAIANAGCDLHGCWAFCWCGVACWDCTKLMINAGIRRAYFMDDGTYARNGGSDYSFGSRWLLARAGVQVVVEKPEVYLS
jgi:deoxycytidylate deaminase